MHRTQPQNPGTAFGEARKREWTAVGHRRSTRSAQKLSQLGICPEAFNRVLHRDAIAEPNQQPGLSIANYVQSAFHCCGDHRSAEIHGLQKYNAESFFAARQNKRITLLVESNQLGVL